MLGPFCVLMEGENWGQREASGSPGILHSNTNKKGKIRAGSNMAAELYA